MTYGSYGDASKKNSGICGVGEMWGFYIGGMLATEEYGGWRYTGNNKWFRPQIMRRLVDDAGLTEKQIYDCLTRTVRSHEMLKNSLISKYEDEEEEINAAFARSGF